MGFDLQNFRDPPLDVEYLLYLVDHVAASSARRLGRLWDYFRNPLVPLAGVAAGAMNANSRPYVQAQEAGLPARITGVLRTDAGREQLTDLSRKEVVVENDIAWRVRTMVDFLFGKPVALHSRAGDPALAATIDAVLTALLDANGGVALLQEMALYGAVYGFVDVALRSPADGRAALPPALPGADAPSAPPAGRPGPSDIPPDAPGDAFVQDTGRDPSGARSNPRLQRAVHAARSLRLETVEAPRVLPVLDENDYRRVRFWIQRYEMPVARVRPARRPWYALGLAGRPAAAPEIVEVVEIVSPTWWQRYEDRRLAAEGPNALGAVPVVHVQNVALAGSYAGLSDVEPLVPLQDELNTRLSDRAHRVTYQSFKMYLGKGIDDFLDRPVGPGQMWATQNLQASIEEFGSDDGSPSEDAHVEQVRQALDKVSGVTPLAAGLIRGNVGRLTSATALKVVLSGLLARTARKRLTYGGALERIADLALTWLDAAGILPTSPADRGVSLQWPDPLPDDEGERLRNALIKSQLGVPPETILAELGYARDASGATA